MEAGLYLIRGMIIGDERKTVGSLQSASKKQIGIVGYVVSWEKKD